MWGSPVIKGFGDYYDLPLEILYDLSLPGGETIGNQAGVLIVEGPEKQKRTQLGPTKNVRSPGGPVGIRDYSSILIE